MRKGPDLVCGYNDLRAGNDSVKVGLGGFVAEKMGRRVYSKHPAYLRSFKKGKGIGVEGG